MRDCLMMPECAHSLCPVPLVCEELDLGYQIDQDDTGCRFTADGETVVQLESQGGMAVLPEEMTLPEPRQKLAQAAQPEVAGGAAVRGSWDHMWCWPGAEVQQSEVAGSVSTEQSLSGGEVQQLEVAECEQQSLHAVLVAVEPGLVAYGLQSG